MDVIEFIKVLLWKIGVANCSLVQYLWDEIKVDIQHLDLFYLTVAGVS